MCMQDLTISVPTEKGKTMFQVVHKETGEIRTVYEKNGAYFLLWNAEKEEWEYDNINNYKPLEASVCAASPD